MEPDFNEAPKMTAKEEEIRRYVTLAKAGDSDAFEFLLNLVEPDIKKIHTQYRWWVRGYDEDDIKSECSIMLMKAIEKFDYRPNTTFRYFAFIFFRRRVISLMDESRRQKHRMLNDASSIDSLLYDEDGNECDKHEKIASFGSDFSVAKKIEDRQYAEYIKAVFFNHLTKMEKEVFELYLENMSYDEISETLNIENKSVDNAIQRAKKKVDKVKEELVGRNIIETPPPVKIDKKKTKKSAAQLKKEYTKDVVKQSKTKK